jgi:four helix bundle protein
MTQNRNTKLYDLEERTLRFAQRVRRFAQGLPKSALKIDDIRQLVRSSGSVGANYIEANESLGKKDFLLRVRIARKEAKESRYWLMIIEPSENLSQEKDALIKEATELMMILSAIMRKSE